MLSPSTGHAWNAFVLFDSWWTQCVKMVESPAVARLLSQAGVEVAILFGSAASGELRPDSDIDIGILLASNRSLDFVAELTLATELEQVLGCEVDLVRLDEASTLLRFEASQGQCLLEKTRNEGQRR